MSIARIILTYKGYDHKNPELVKARDLATYVEQTVMEDTGEGLGRLEALEQNLSYSASILGRLLEHLIVTRAIDRPEVLEHILLGHVTGHFTNLKILAPGDNDDAIPF